MSQGWPYKAKKPRPHQWKSGPDLQDHEIYYNWMLRRAQAKHRKEEWDLSWDDFHTLWKNDWNNKGRLAHNVCMTRMDPEKPWNKENTILVTRHEHLKRQAEFKVAKKKWTN